MSRRGGKRKPVLQLGNSSSKLHRYGYSKEFHSTDKRGKATPALVGDYSDSDSDSESDTDQHQPGDFAVSEEGPLPDSKENQVDMNGDKPAPPQDMDDELKNFLSEIEAIPLPTDIGDNRNQTVTDVQPMPAAGGSDGDISTTVNSSIQETKSKSEKGGNKYSSMFVKGEPEFVGSPAIPEEGEKKKETKDEEEKEDIPEEPTSNWQMVQDEASQYYYYWNILTNEVTWEIPSEYTQFLLLHREYEEKMARYTPEEIQALTDKKQSRNGKEDTTIKSRTKTVLTSAANEGKNDSVSSSSDMQQLNGNTARHRLEDDTEQLPLAASLSPPSSDGTDSKYEKNRREKKRHHKKKEKDKENTKHIRKDKESFSHLPDSNEFGPVMGPDVKPTITPEAGDVNSPKLLSIVPYLSDQEEDDNEDLIDSKPPKLGSNTSLPDVSSQGEEPKIPELKPEAQVLSDETSVTQPGLQVKELSSDKFKELSRDNCSPLPSESQGGQPVEEETCANDKNDLEDEWHSQKIKNDHPVGESEDIPKVKTDQGQKEDEIKDKIGDNTAISIHPFARKAENVKDKEIIDMFKPKEVIDMFEDDGISGKDVKVETLAQDLKLQPVAEVKASLKDGGEVLKTEKIVDTHEEEEMMEEGELVEPSEQVSKNKDGEKVSLSVQERVTVEKIDTNSQDEKRTDTKKGSGINIVGYASDGDEEEGELREEDTVVKRAENPSKNSSHTSSQGSKDRRGDSPSHSSRKKKKDRHERHKRSKGNSPSHFPSIIDKHLDKDIMSKVSETLDKAIADIVTKTVTSGHNLKAKELESSGDLDFEDLDDIDRALEVALEKKMEKKKVESAKSEPVKSPTRHMDGDDTKGKEGIEKVKAVEEKDQILPTETTNDPDVLQAQVKDIVELALNKLEFLDISTDNLSRLQVLFIELQTRYTDWNAGGLSTVYFLQQLKVAEGLLEQYELSAVPQGWACQWDRANCRYYYRNKLTNQIQWEYPEMEKKDTQKVKDDDVIVIADGDEPRKQRSSRHRKRDEKDKSKSEKRSSSHRYRRKRRRRRGHSSDDNSASEESQHSRHHHKSKKKKRHRTEKSPSVEIVHDSVDVEEAEKDVMTDSPSLSTQTTSILPSEPVTTQLTTLSASVDDEGQSSLFPPPPPPPPPEEEDEEMANVEKEVESCAAEENQEANEEEVDKSPENPAIISRPPQIVVPPVLAATITPELQTTPQLYSAPQISSTHSSSYTSQQPLLTNDQNPPASESLKAPVDSSIESEAHGKKKKKEKKSLATGSSLMMKKKHMSSMVQKWQKVKKEVEKEDQAKEMRQAAIRKKIEELK